MRKSQDRGLAFKGEITAFMALIFILLLSVVGALIESASIQITKNRKRADTILALESTFAEYHPEMLDQYELFVRLGCTENLLNDRLSYYGAANMTHEIEKFELLTDYNATPFYKQAVGYMKDWLGMEEMTFESELEFKDDTFLKEKELSNSQELQSILEAEEAELPEENNPIKSVENLKKSNLLSILVSNPEELSNRSITIETLPSGRELQKGNWEESKGSGTSDKLFFIAYINEHFSNMTTQNEERTLLYEQEYLLGGKASDQENLEVVCKKIMNIRTALNYTYLLTDSTKKAEAEAMSALLCALIAQPELIEVVKQAILLAWAYGESVVDMRALLKGKKVPLVKTEENWQLQLSNLVKLGTEEEVASEKDIEGGLGYQEYLKGLFLLADKGTLSMRCLDLIESNLHIKTDQCMTKVKIKSEVNLRRGIQDTFNTTFGYQ